MLIICYFCFNN